MPAQFPWSPRQRVLWPVAFLIVGGLVFGGASRLEVMGSMAVLAIAVLAACVTMFRAGRDGFAVDRFALLLMVGFAGWMLIQLIPLPFGIWSSLPGRELAVQTFQSIGDAPWQPISLTPHRTAAAFFALVAPFVAFVAISALDHSARRDAAMLIVMMGVASALLGLLQVAGGEASALRFYRITDSSSGVGLFANPNHQATLLAVTTLLLFVWLGDRFPERGALPSGAMVATASLLVLIALAIFYTRSRAGIVFFAAAVVVGLALLPFDRIHVGHAARKWMRGGAVVGVLFAICGSAFVVTSSRFRDFFELDNDSSRLDLLPRFARIISDYFPVGSGFGSFDPVYRTYETLETLDRSYLNQAHNEPAQMLIEGGLIALLLMLGLLFWVALRGRDAWRGGLATREDTRLRRSATAAVLIVLVHSLVDYPLRTSGMAIVFAAACAFMLAAPGATRRSSRRTSR